MPLLTRASIKVGLVYLVVALLMGVAVTGQAALNLPPTVTLLRPVYIHLLIVGWVTQLIFGVIYWMFPKESKERPRGSERLGWFVFISLNAGLILRALGEPLVALRPDLGAGWMVVASSALQVLAAWGFILNTWRRVKER